MRFGIRLAFLLAAVLTVAPVSAQYAEVPRPMPVPSAGVFGSSPGWFTAATQIDRRLFVAGAFSRLSPPTGSAVVVNLVGHYIPGAFPYFAGTVTGIVADSAGGWLVVGDFVSVNGRPIARFARVAPDRTVDERYRVVADGAIAKVALAHGRIYLAGDFTAVNGAARRGLAALDAVTWSPHGVGRGLRPTRWRAGVVVLVARSLRRRRPPTRASVGARRGHRSRALRSPGLRVGGGGIVRLASTSAAPGSSVRCGR